MQTFNLDIQQQEDDAFLVDCSVHIRELNRQLQWQLPTDGPKTLNGLILEQLEYIPEAGTTLKIENYLIEITQVSENSVKMARLSKLQEDSETDDN